MALVSLAARAAHTHHDPAGTGARCVSCHMPRLVYGVLDAHRSHRIETPDPARAVAMGRPDACTLCHVEADRAWAVRERERLWPSSAGSVPASRDHARQSRAPTDLLAPRDALFAGDPVARALAADAIGRAPWPADLARAAEAAGARTAALLEVAANDRYPAVRHLAARALDRILTMLGSPAAVQARRFDATAPELERRRIVAAIREQLQTNGARIPRASPSCGSWRAGNRGVTHCGRASWRRPRIWTSANSASDNLVFSPNLCIMVADVKASTLGGRRLPPATC